MVNKFWKFEDCVSDITDVVGTTVELVNLCDVHKAKFVEIVEWPISKSKDNWTYLEEMTSMLKTVSSSQFSGINIVNDSCCSSITDMTPTYIWRFTNTLNILQKLQSNLH